MCQYDLLAAASTGSLVGGQLLLHTGGLVHLLGIKGHPAQGAERRGHLQTGLQTLPAEPGEETGRSARWRVLISRIADDVQHHE